MTFARTHLPCPDCGSTDALAENEDGSTKCFSCGKSTRSKDFDMASLVTPYTLSKKPLTEPFNPVYGGFSDRRISNDTAKSFGVIKDGDNVLFPYHNGAGVKVAQKVRDSDKNFRTEGEWKNAKLFGHQLFSEGGRYVTITEGEFDALAVYQIMGGYPVVSVKNGAAGAVKDCQENYEWLDSFETIVVCFDNDAPGIEAANKVAELFLGKVKIVKHELGFKDACDYLKANKEKLFSRAWYNAKEYRPEGVITVEDIREQLLNPIQEGVPWCFPSLSTHTYGRREGELYAFGAGVGVGKTDVFTQQIAYDIDTLKLPVGVIYLEQSPIETAQRIAGKIDKRLYHVPDGGFTQEEYVRSIDKLIEMNRLYMMNHFGAKSWAEVKKRIIYFSRACNIKMIYLDHLTALSANEDDERRALDSMMADMASLAQSDGLIIHFVSHLTTPEGKAHEEGGRVLEKQFTGSRAIARWAHFMFGLERNKQHEDPDERQITTFRVLKDRFTGRATGQTFKLKYNKANGFLTEYNLDKEF